jgi:gamma-glutamyltranspeptidase / glutathione hydrolase
MGEIPEFTTRPELAGTFGMVASTHWLASAAGMAVLEQGGNAFDAAVAAGLVLQVTEPHLNGPGGEVPIIAHHADRGETFVLCGQGTAPAAATLEAFGDLGLDLVPGSGLLAACVPGAFGAWMLLLREYGTLRLRDVIGYAIGYAARGYPVLPAISWAIASVAEMFRDHWPSSAEVYLPGGTVPAPGSLFANPALADTYQRILDEAEAASGDRDEQIEAARRVYYEGFVAETIAAYVASAEVMDVTGRRHRGLLSYADLSAWRPRLEEPLTYDYQGLTVCKTRPWGQGPVFTQQLALLEGFDLAAIGPGRADYIHTVIECAKLAFADREAWYGDPDFTDVPVKTLLSAEYADARRALVGLEASAELRPGGPDGRPPRLPGFAAGASHALSADASLSDPMAPATAELDPGTGEPTMRASGSGGPAASSYRAGDTCHLDVADRFGNMVSATPSGGWLQSSPVVPGLGFCLGTRAQMFTLTPGLPATLAPGKRPRPTLSTNRAVPGVRHARRRPAGPVVAAVLPQSRAGRDEPAAGDRLPVVPLRAHAVVVLPAPGSAPRARRRVARGDRRDRGPAAPRPSGQRPAGLVARPGQLGCPSARRAVCRGQPPRHAGLRRRPLIPSSPVAREGSETGSSLR